MIKKEYIIKKTKTDTNKFMSNEFWEGIRSASVDNYLWINNDYKPKVDGKLCYSDEYLFVNFKSFEKDITANRTRINEPVHKDSCVELFINLFPNKTKKYFNFEINALGVIFVAFGTTKERSVLPVEEIEKIQIHSIINKQSIGDCRHDYWEIFYKIPFNIFEKYYESKFEACEAKVNFYKCGDESLFEHYGVWNNIESSKPNFHLPDYFGKLIFH